jgi:hypothetical protein
MRSVFLCGLLLFLAARAAMAQVQVDVRLEKTEYLVGEPVGVIIDVRNNGGEPVGYSSCGGNVRLTIVGATRRTLPSLSGCFSGIGFSTGGAGCSGHLRIPPGQAKRFTYVLQDYDLRPGHYQLRASGTQGAQFDRMLPVTVVASTPRELRAALAPLIANADAADPEHRQYARSAIIESAAPFLDSLIARFAAEERLETSAIEALGRIASTRSRTHLKNLFHSTDARRRSAIVIALARVGHRDDADFLAGFLQDGTNNLVSRQLAALGLGRIGGDQAVKLLEGALVTASELRPMIATALGNTRSRAAVPVLIGMFGNNPSRNSVCGALRTLTHRSWCGGTADDPSATRRQWLRWWNEHRSKTSLFGPDNCPADPVVTEAAPSPIFAAKPSPTASPRVTSVSPTVVAPNAVLEVAGYALGIEDTGSVQIMFVRGSLERPATIGGAGEALNGDPDGGFQFMEVFVPADLSPGRWELVVTANGRRSAPFAVEIAHVTDVQLTGISPQRAHPAQRILLTTKAPAHIGDAVQLTDARGRTWRLASGVSSLGIGVTLPDEVADGEASIRLERQVNGEQRLGAPLTFSVTSGPLPLKPLAVALMQPVSPGQWTDLVRDSEIEFEVRRADRIEVEFTQGSATEVSRVTGPDQLHVRVPARMKPGVVSMRTRTWIERTASEWSAPTELTLLERPVPPTITAIEVGPLRTLMWWSGEGAPSVVDARSGEALVLRGQFPVAEAGDLRVQIRGSRTMLELKPTDVEGGVRVELPSQASPGDWRLLVGIRNDRTSSREIATVRVK